MDIIETLNWRHSTKVFDASKKIESILMDKIESILQLSPSSTNIQPWYFVIASTDEGKRRIAKSTQGGYSFNEQKILDASAVVVFATRIDTNEKFLNHVLNKEDKDARYANEELKYQTHNGRCMFVDIHKFQIKDSVHWLEKQVYLNLGFFLLGVATLGIDAQPMEGFDVTILNDELGLKGKGFTASCIVSLGYRSSKDYNASLPKSRLVKGDIIKNI